MLLRLSNVDAHTGLRHADVRGGGATQRYRNAALSATNVKK